MIHVVGMLEEELIMELTGIKEFSIWDVNVILLLETG